VPIEYYCDACGVRTERNRVDSRIQRRLGPVVVEIMVGVVQGPGPAPSWNGGIVCEACVLRTVLDGEAVRRVVP
jgi:hypothetical protein